MQNKVHAVGVIFENEKKEILILLRHKQDPEGGTWGLVGGKIDPGETKEQTAIREVREEIKHKLDNQKLEFMRTYSWDREDINLLFEVFKIKINQNELKLELAQNENTEYKWILPTEALRRKDLMKGLYPILEDIYKLT